MRLGIIEATAGELVSTFAGAAFFLWDAQANPDSIFSHAPATNAMELTAVFGVGVAVGFGLHSLGKGLVKSMPHHGMTLPRI